MKDTYKDKRNNKTAAILYDVDNRNKKDDILFYLKQAQKTRGSVLELGCGTGRVSIPLIRHDIKVTAIDSSQSMIEVFRKKAKNLIDKKNIEIMRGDLTEVRLSKKFDLIIMPFRVFQYLLSVDEQQKALLNIKHHLTPNGLLIFDIYYPNFKILSNIPSEEEVDGEFTFRNKQIIKSHINKSIDILNQVVTTDIIYSEYLRGKKKVILKNTTKTRYSFRFEIEHLLKLNGFFIKQLLSDYKSKKFVAGKEMIFVCGRRGRIPSLNPSAGNSKWPS